MLHQWAAEFDSLFGIVSPISMHFQTISAARDTILTKDYVPIKRRRSSPFVIEVDEGSNAMPVEIKVQGKCIMGRIQKDLTDVEIGKIRLHLEPRIGNPMESCLDAGESKGNNGNSLSPPQAVRK